MFHLLLDLLIVPPCAALTLEDAEAILQIEAQRQAPLALGEYIDSADPATL